MTGQQGQDDPYFGYRGAARDFMEKNSINIWDKVEFTSDNQSFSGIVLPRYGFCEDGYLSIKLDGTGYNFGILITGIVSIKKIGKSKGSYHPPPSNIIPARNLPRVPIIGCGGTIASRLDYRTGGVIPALTPDELFAMFPELANIAMIETTLLFSRFSEDMNLDYWGQAAERVVEEINKGATGVVVAHGTDTLGYGGAALSFSLQDLPVPVVITGSQRSSDRPSSDAFQNLMDSVRVAAQADLAGIFVLMHGGTGDVRSYLHEGTKVRKMHSSRRDAFQSIDQLPVGEVNHLTGEITLQNIRSRRQKEKDVKLFTSFERKIGLIYTYPGAGGELIDHFVNGSYKGIVIAGTGLGHTPEGMIPAIQRGIENGIHFVMTTQCLHGFTGMNVYERGRELLAAGVIPGGPLLPETAFIKLAYVLGKEKDPEKIRQMMQSNLVGEMTVRERFDSYTNV
ncbi:MAG: Glu-tRNA(Gln) amidotransferase subunit GatD [Candidatus Odinarchaeota archaeon]